MTKHLTTSLLRSVSASLLLESLQTRPTWRMVTESIVDDSFQQLVHICDSPYCSDSYWLALMRTLIQLNYCANVDASIHTTDGEVQRSATTFSIWHMLLTDCIFHKYFLFNWQWHKIPIRTFHNLRGWCKPTGRRIWGHGDSYTTTRYCNTHIPRTSCISLLTPMKTLSIEY